MINHNLTQRISNLHDQMKQAAPIQQDKAALNYVKPHSIATFHEGDVLEGKIIQDHNGKLGLKLSPETILPVVLKENVPMHTLMNFMVTGNKSGFIHLQTMQNQTKHTLVEKVAQNLNLPMNEKMGKCIQQFIEAEQPLDKVELLKTYHLTNKLQLPIQVVMNLSDKMGVSANEFFVGVEKHISQPPDQQASLLKQILFEDGDLSIQDKIHNSIKLLETMLGKGTLALPHDLKEQLLKDQVISTGANDDAQLILSHLKNSLNQTDRQLNDSSTWLDIIKKQFEAQFEVTNKESLRKQLEKDDSKFFNSTDKLEELLEKSEELHLSEKGLKILNELKDPLQTWSKLNHEGDYYHYPFFLNEQKKEAEIYFYKPKKEAVTNKKDFYAVIALDFESIKHIDIHVHQIDKEIELLIEVEDPSIQKIFNQYSEKLLQKVIDKGYSLRKYNCSIKTTKETHLKEQSFKESLEGINIKI